MGSVSVTEFQTDRDCRFLLEEKRAGLSKIKLINSYNTNIKFSIKLEKNIVSIYTFLSKLMVMAQTISRWSFTMDALGSIPGQYMWDLWCRKWHWGVICAMACPECPTGVHKATHFDVNLYEFMTTLHVQFQLNLF
jgi:hypothetical protein